MKFYVAKIPEDTRIVYYLFTDEEATYYCRLSPSYWFEACGVKTETQNAVLDELLHNYLHELSYYVHHRDIDSIQKEVFGDFDSMDEALEAFQTSQRYF